MIDLENKRITGENLCNNLAAIGDGYTVRDCNLSQRGAHTAILSKVKGLTFEGCNLKNCDLPEGAIIKDCLVCHEDVLDPTPEEIALAAEKMDVEQAALEDYRVKLQTELSACATVDDVVLEDIVTAIAVKQTADIKPVEVKP